MFERINYKNQAREQLKGKLKTPIIAFVVTMAITAMAAGLPQENLDGTTGLISFLLISFINSVSFFAFLRIFIQIYNTKTKAEFSDFINSFSHFVKAFLGFLWFYLWVGLWSLLFFFPGIVKAFSYSQMFFVLSENPKISVSKAMNISKVLTRNHKGDLFLMSLSFLGWEFLSMLTLFILQIWIKPYEAMSFTNAYYALKEEAFRTGSLTPADFES
ncbi:MAG: DUF975 family protein [Treponema succinifaciens]|uniref:DUF975 family protein n=1 Tax=Treponema TaxID=157 RepID=UPI0023F1A924|nr:MULTISPECIES: DUF975 family protein [Treponema]MDD6962784.1 DUF975 family protein [Treponema succinifaciens]MDY5116610.1 DUF975 family protein [Treponema succinifaciens]